MTTTPAGPTSPSIGVVVVAGGSGSRLGQRRPKAFVPLVGRPMVDHALDPVRAVSVVTDVVIAVPESHLAMSHPDWAGAADLGPVTLVAGGAERSDSVRAGLAALPARCDIVVVHDAARCLTPTSVFERVIAAVAQGAAGAIPGLPLVDTIKQVDAQGYVTGTVDRASLRAVQTPQAFRREVLAMAHSGGRDGTDDAVLVELAGYRVVVVPGDERAFKVTTPGDLDRARWLLERGSEATALPDMRQ